MKLTLRNIRQFGLRELVFPENGLVLLRGESGAGKSSVLDSIEYCLYGGRKGIKSFGASSCAVELIGFGLDVKRTRNPNVLRANGFEGDLAQAEIQRVLGMSEEDFSASSYIAQDLHGSLLALPPSDQLRLIQGLAAGHDNPEAVKGQIKDHIRKQELRLVESQTEIRFLTASLLEKQEKLKAFGAAKQRLEEFLAGPARDLESLPKLEAERRACADRLREAKDSLIAVAAHLLNPLYSLEERIAAAEGRCASIKTKLRRELELQKERLQKIGSLWIRSDASSPEMTRSKIETISRALNQRGDVDRERLNIQALQRDLERLRDATRVQACPECMAPLVIIDGELVKAGHKETVASAVDAEIAMIRSRLKEAELRYEKVVADRSAFEEELKGLRIYEDDQRQKAWERKLIEQEISSLETRMAAEQQALDDLKAQATQLGTISPRENLEQQRQNLANKIHAEEERLRYFDHEIARLQRLHQQLLELRQHEERRKEYEADAEGVKRRLAAAESVAKDCVSRLRAAFRLKELSDKAATDAVDATIDTINISARHYIDAFFQDTGTSVLLTSETTLGSGEKRPRLDVEIFHKGHRYESLRDLSGGERTRMSLAFQLALSEMVRSPLLMIDEGLKGLNVELKELCLESLAEIAKEKLVLVAEHGAPESAFDLVIDLT